MSRAALLIVDVQKGFITPATQHIPALVEARQPDYPLVVATRFFNPAGSNFRRLIHWERFAPGSSEIDLAFQPVTGAHVIDKAIYTCITPQFLDLLAQQNIGEVHLCGIDTDICVTKCAVDLFEAGQTPVVLADLCASHAGPEMHAAALRILHRYIGKDQVR